MEDSNCTDSNKCKKKVSQKTFESTIDMQKHINKENEQYRLAILDQEANQELIQKQIYQYNYDDFENGFYNNITGLMDDLMYKPFNTNFFTKDQRVFFMGILLMIIVIGIFVLNLIF